MNIKKINDIVNSDGDKIQTKIDMAVIKCYKYCTVSSLEIESI